MLEGFKKFIMQGNVIDLAVGLIVGAAFGRIVTALNDNFLMPIIAGLFGKPNFDSVLQFHIHESLVQPGVIITAVVNFLIVSAALYFCLILPMNKLRERRASGEDVEELPDNEELAVLKDIREQLLIANGSANAAGGNAAGGAASIAPGKHTAE